MLSRQESLFDRIGKLLRAQGADIQYQPLPKRWIDLIRYLDEQERKQPGSSLREPHAETSPN